MKLKNRELKDRIFHKIQVVTNLYVQCTTFEVVKHRFKQPLRRKEKQLCLRKQL